MREFKEGAEIVEGRMTFVQEFLQKKYGFGIVFFVIILGGFVTAIMFYNRGKEDEKENTKNELTSLKNNRQSDSIEIKYLNTRVSYYKKALDTCNSNSLSNNLEKQVRKAFEEVERIKKITELNNKLDRKDINTMVNSIKN